MFKLVNRDARPRPTTGDEGDGGALLDRGLPVRHRRDRAPRSACGVGGRAHPREAGFSLSGVLQVHIQPTATEPRLLVPHELAAGERLDQLRVGLRPALPVLPEALGAPHQIREKDTKLAQKLGQRQPFIAVFPQDCAGQLAYFGPT